MTSVKGPPWLENWKQRLTYQKSFTYYVQIPSLVGVFEQSVHNDPKNIFSTGHILQQKFIIKLPMNNPEYPFEMM